MAQAPTIIDLLYCDTEKCQALLSQLDAEPAGPEAAKPYPLFQRLTKKLDDLHAVLDVNAAAIGASEVLPIHQKVKGASLLKVDGWASLEDYERFKHTADSSSAIIEFIGRCTIHSVEQSEEYKKAQIELDNVRAVLKKEVDRNKRSTLEARVKAMETRFRTLVAERTQMEGLPDWMVQGLGLFIDAFLQGRTTLRIFPVEALPEFNVIADLKKECVVNGSLQNILNAFGARPTVKLSILGMVTAVPEAGGHAFDPMARFKRLMDQNQDAKLEQVFRQFFNALEMLEGLVGLSRYPNVTVAPLAVYRAVKLG